MTDKTMTDSKLQEFIANTAARGRITFGDVSRLRRDHLPNGVASREQVEMLMRLDCSVVRVDRAWTEWLATSVVGFVLCDERPVDGSESATCKWLKALVAAIGKSTKASRQIAREIRCDAERAAPVTPALTKTPASAKKSAAKETTAAKKSPVKKSTAKESVKERRSVAPAAIAKPASTPAGAMRLAAYVTFDCRNLAGSFARTMPQPFFGPML
jgi:hypothetical protein